MDWLKSKINEIAVLAVSGLIALQIIMPMFIDIVFSAMIAALAWLAAKSSK